MRHYSYIQRSKRVFAALLAIGILTSSALPLYAETLSAPGSALKKETSLTSFSVRVASRNEIYKSPKEKASVVCVVESMGNEFQQLNVTKVLDRVLADYHIRHIFQEGSAGDASLAILKPYADKNTRMKMGRDYLMKGFISGGEYLSLASDHDFFLSGTEDSEIYRTFLLNYLEVSRHEEKIKGYLNKLDNIIASIKMEINSSDARRLDLERGYLKAGQITPRHYLETLVETVGIKKISGNKFNTAKYLNELSSAEREINWAKAEEEALAVYKSLSTQTQNDLIRYAGRRPSPELQTLDEEDTVRHIYFSALLSKIPQPSNYPFLLKYINYVHRFNPSQSVYVLRELEELESFVYLSAAESKEEKEIQQISEKIRVARRFLSLHATSDWKSLKRDLGVSQMKKTEDNLRSLLGRVKRAANAQLPELPKNEFQEMMQAAIKFYDLGFKLDRAFFEGMMRRMASENTGRWAVVVTERRMENLRDFFKSSDISYEVLVPRATGLIKGGYFERLLDMLKLMKGKQPGKSERIILKNGFVIMKPTLLASMRDAIVYDLVYDREPLLWRMGKDLALTTQQNIQVFLEAMDDRVVESTRKLGLKDPELLWLRNQMSIEARKEASNTKASVQKKIEESDASFERITEDIDDKFNLEKYNEYKAFVDDKDSPRLAPKREQLEYIEKKLRAYEGSVKSSADEKEKQVQEKFSKAYGKGTQRYSNIYQSSAGWYMNYISEMVPSLVLQLAKTTSEAKMQGVLEFKPDFVNIQNTVDFLLFNITQGSMPLGYYAPEGYWEKYRPMMNELDAILERILIHYGVSIYDAALWQISLAIQGNSDYMPLVDNYTMRLESGSSGTLQDIRAYGPGFKYGDEKKILKKENSYFFRIIADEYFQVDPLDKRVVLQGFPNFEALHHEDWKPITGEQAWAAIIGPLQVAYVKYHGRIPLSAREIQLAVNILPAIYAMKSPIGAIYHAPDGTHQKDPHDISNENNFSMYAALKMLRQAVDGQSPRIDNELYAVVKGQEDYFRNYAYDAERGVFYQGGFYADGRFVPNKIFAVDCQTWGILALGPAWIDKHFGEGTSFRIWQNTKQRGGYYDSEGILRGVGFTDGHNILSVEWTCGAILATAKLVEEYKISHPEWAREAQLDLLSMRYGIEKYKMTLPNGSVGYFYANKRFFIPFGWWANPIPCIASSAWVVLIDTGYNPFVLGGGAEFKKADSALPAYYTFEKSLVALPAKEEKSTPKLAPVAFQPFWTGKQAPGMVVGEKQVPSVQLSPFAKLRTAVSNAEFSAFFSKSSPVNVNIATGTSWWQMFLDFLRNVLRVLSLVFENIWNDVRVRFIQTKEFVVQPFITTSSTRPGALAPPVPLAGTRLFKNAVEEAAIDGEEARAAEDKAKTTNLSFMLDPRWVAGFFFLIILGWLYFSRRPRRRR